MLEVETKFRIDDPEVVKQRLVRLGASGGPTESHADTYLRHPCRDFVQTKEALRVRRVNGIASVTYKGPKLDVAAIGLKARKEIEWCLAPGDADGMQMQTLFESLGFEPVATVRKQRQTFRFEEPSPRSSFTVTVDRVDQVGTYAEIELLIDDGDSDGLAEAGEQIQRLAGELGFVHAEMRSYLSLLLQDS
ncbi:class IV adenylate cyclase [Roseiconus lacunae]|uniref:class IV adenylate cyclase n=1 Tax=Roseiconus lacunae TaxID=2605694 RepID=UPI0011F22FE6|nr:class IV adenylate cyclase [Roseiconus lacunae]